MKGLPFRRRLTVWSTLVAAVSICICGMGAAWFVYQRELMELDEELRTETGHFYSELNRHGAESFDWRKIESELREWMPTQNPPHLIEIRTGAEVRWRSPGLPDPGFSAQPVGVHRQPVAGDSMRLLVTEQDGITFAIASNLDDAKGTARGLALGLLVSLPLALAFAWFGGRRLAAFAVEPVEEMTAAAERVTAERLDQRVPVPPVADEIQRHAQVLNATLDRLERSYQQALRFSADASHELKTPLTVLRVSIEALLESATLAGGDHEVIASLLEQTHRLSNITASLLLLARADAGRLVLDAGEHDLAALTEACAEDARIMAEGSGVSVECALPPTAPARVDALRFAQIISNLLDNAVKYNHPGGEVRLALTDGGTRWTLSVANTGPGIAPGDRDHLFERFFRSDQMREEAGHGLGLSLARELAHAHGGEIALVRSDGEWTEFGVTLPKNGSPNQNGASHRVPHATPAHRAAPAAP